MRRRFHSGSRRRLLCNVTWWRCATAQHLHSVSQWHSATHDPAPHAGGEQFHSAPYRQDAEALRHPRYTDRRQPASLILAPWYSEPQLQTDTTPLSRPPRPMDSRIARGSCNLCLVRTETWCAYGGGVLGHPSCRLYDPLSRSALQCIPVDRLCADFGLPRVASCG